MSLSQSESLFCQYSCNEDCLTTQSGRRSIKVGLLLEDSSYQALFSDDVRASAGISLSQKEEMEHFLWHIINNISHHVSLDGVKGADCLEWEEYSRRKILNVLE